VIQGGVIAAKHFSAKAPFKWFALLTESADVGIFGFSLGVLKLNSFLFFVFIKGIDLHQD
jgi:hypothetical protein